MTATDPTTTVPASDLTSPAGRAALLHTRGLTPWRLAGQAGVKYESVRRWLSGRGNLQAPTVARLAAALDLPADQLVAPRVGTPLDRAITTAGMSTRQVAAAAGVSDNRVSDWRAGRATPGPAAARRLAALLDRDVAVLFADRPHLLQRLTRPHDRNPAGPPPRTAGGTGASRPDTRLGRLLDDRGLTARQLAAAAGVHENTVYAWLSRRSDPSPATLAATATALAVPAERLHPLVARRLPAPHGDAAVVLATGAGDRQRDRLAEAMRTRGWTACQLADAAGVDRAAVAHWLAGRRRIRPDTAGRVAAALGIDVEQLRPDLHAATPLARHLATTGWTGARLAQQTGLPVDRIGHWIAGTRPNPDAATRIAAALGVAAADLFPPSSPTAVTQEEDRSPLGGGRGVDDVLQLPATGDPQWQRQAVCADDDADPEAWWPPPGGPADTARAGCARCPVAGDCRDAFLADPQLHRDGGDGIWAGLRGRALLAAHRRHQTRTAATAGSSRGTGASRAASTSRAVPAPPPPPLTRAGGRGEAPAARSTGRRATTPARSL